MVSSNYSNNCQTQGLFGDVDMIIDHGGNLILRYILIERNEFLG